MGRSYVMLCLSSLGIEGNFDAFVHIELEADRRVP